MDLYFSGRRFFQTGFHLPCLKTTRGDQPSCQFKEIYRVSTTVKKSSILPEKTTIEYVGAEDEEKHYVVATIEWRWPSQQSSLIEIDGEHFQLKEFLKKEGLFGTGMHVMIADDRFTWRSAVCRPAQLFDIHNHSVARLTPHTCDLEPSGRVLVVQPGCLHISPDVAVDAYTRNFVVASFFVYRACRDLQVILTPWWNEKQADFAGLKLKAKK